MSFSINLTGHLTDQESTSDDVIEVFDNAVRALRTIGANPQGSLSGTENNQPFTRSVSDVVDLQAEDTSDDGAPTSDDSAVDGG